MQYIKKYMDSAKVLCDMCENRSSITCADWHTHVFSGKCSHSYTGTASQYNTSVLHT